MTQFSVVIPLYNAAWCIRETLDSVAAQTCDDLEVIAVDDGSTDSTAKIVEDYFHQGIFRNALLIRQSNKGLGGARNSGVRKATGEFLAFLDQDDFWRPHRLARIAEIIGRGESGMGLVCNDEEVTRDGKVIGVNRYGPWAQDMFERLLFYGNCLSPSAVVVRRDLVEQVGGFWELESGEDYDLWLKLSRLTRFEFLHEPLGEYRLHSNNLSAGPDHNLWNILRVHEHHLSILREKRPLSWMEEYRARRMKSAAYRAAVARESRKGEVLKALGYSLKALRMDPFTWKNWLFVPLAARGFLRESSPAGRS